ncbi:MAG TPA: apolipoprotein N-acyltransferase [Sedimentisphaerales bacterium]|nr:apolipoprotein N-acyltransferase [Sedimentisphaerales bacterium]
MKSAKIRDILVLCWPLVASAVMLTVIQPPISFSALAWVSLVPFILACSPKARPKRLALAAYVISLFYWLGNLYWIFPVTVVGWAAFCLYTALLWPIVAFCLRYCRRKNVPLFLAVPVLVVGAERLQGFFLGGFFWRFLAHSQYANITLIQIADIFGAAGLSFLIAMVNGLVAELIIAGAAKRIFTVANLLKAASVCIALVAAVAYGRWRIEQADKFVETGPLVASLQSNIPQSVKRTFQAEEEIFAALMQDSNSALQAGAELIVWPETMVQAILNTDIWKLFDSSGNRNVFDEARRFHHALEGHSKGKAFLLVGAYGGRLRQQSDGTNYLARYNSAFLYTPAGQLDDKQYDKIHLVPFGEVVPFRRRLPALYNFLMKFTPYNYDYSLDYGTDYTVFEITGREGLQARLYRFSVMICYEDTIPAIARTFAKSENGRKGVDWLVNISNDGWFVRFTHGKVLASTELRQHMAVCVFRAVENRLAVLRSVNTGISCLIDTLGRVRDGYVAGNLPAQAMDRKGIAGWFVDKMPIDKRVTFFSRCGQWLDFCCALCLVLLIILPSTLRFIGTNKLRVRLSGKQG